LGALPKELASAVTVWGVLPSSNVQTTFPPTGMVTDAGVKARFFTLTVADEAAFAVDDDVLAAGEGGD
jgi:hypothetical protein